MIKSWKLDERLTIGIRCYIVEYIMLCYLFYAMFCISFKCLCESLVKWYYSKISDSVLHAVIKSVTAECCLIRCIGHSELNCPLISNNNMPYWIKRRVLGYTMLAGVGFSVLWMLSRWLRRRDQQKKTKGSLMKVLFFPDNEVSCRTHFTERHGCSSQRCRFSHDPQNAYAQLLQ